MSIELKIKQVSLTDEAIYIKIQEEKLLEHANKCYRKAQEANDDDIKKKYTNYALQHVWKAQHLKDHRKGIVADEARSTNIARAYLKGKPYAYAESEGFYRDSPPNIKRIAQITYKYSIGRGFLTATNSALDKQIKLIEDWIEASAKVK